MHAFLGGTNHQEYGFEFGVCVLQLRAQMDGLIVHSSLPAQSLLE